MQVRYVTVILSIAVATCASPAAPQRTEERETTSATPQSAWKLFYSSGTTLSEAAGGLPVITMPTSGTANMLTKAWSGSAAGSTLHLTIQVDTTGTPLFHLAQGPEPTCRTPPSARPYLEAVGWEAMPPPYPSMRWWSRQAFVALAQAGTFSIDVKQPYRLLFVPIEETVPKDRSDERARWAAITKIEIVKIEDTHG